MGFHVRDVDANAPAAGDPVLELGESGPPEGVPQQHVFPKENSRGKREKIMDLQKRPEQDPQGDRFTVLAQPRWGAVTLYVLCVSAGAVAGWLISLLADWFVTLPWAPMQDLARLVASFSSPVMPAAGAVAGLAVGFIAHREQLGIRLSDDRVVLTRKGREQEFTHDAVAAAFLDGDELVLLGTDGGELAREECDAVADEVPDAFTEHGYVWADADPHNDEFRRWVPDTPGLPEGANAILKARQKSLEKKDPSERDIRELREELARLGVVVKDEKRRQYWRTLRKADPVLD